MSDKFEVMKFKGVLEVEYVPAKDGKFRVHLPMFAVTFWNKETGNGVIIQQEECEDAKQKFDSWAQSAGKKNSGFCPKTRPGE